MPHNGSVGGSGGSPPVLVLPPSPVLVLPPDSVAAVVSAAPRVVSSSFPLLAEFAVVTTGPEVLAPRESDVDELLVPDAAASDG